MPSVDDQITVGEWFEKDCYTEPDGRKARTSTVKESIGERLNHQVKRILENLEDIDILKRTDPPGSGRYIRHERSGSNFFPPFTEDRREMEFLYKEDRTHLMEDIRAQQSGQEKNPRVVRDGGEKTVGDIASEILKVPISQIEAELLRSEDLIERIALYDEVVSAIAAEDRVNRSGEYGQMGWRNASIKWSLTQTETRRERNQSL